MNVKASFCIESDPQLDADSASYLYYSAGSVMILKYKEFTYTLMEKKKEFINLTGCNSFKKINEAVYNFTYLTNRTKIYNMKINTITFTLKIKLENDRFIYFKNNKPTNFTIKRFPKFCGVCFKYDVSKISENYFHKSKKMVVMGGRNFYDMVSFTRDLLQIGFKAI